MEKRLRCIVLNNKPKLVNISAQKLRPLLIEHKIFTLSMLDDICNNSCDLIDELVTRGPDAFGKFIKVLNKGGYREEADILNNVPNSVPKILKGPCYKILSEPLGLCLVINNVEFSNQKKRYGSKVDAENLFKVFEKIGFLVLPETDLTAKEMENRLSEFAKDERWGFLDSCIVIILSHGNNIDNMDVVFGTDGEYLTKSNIIKMFSNRNCPKLLGKPKIFIFQACRGDDEDSGVAYFCESTDAGPKIVPEKAIVAKVSHISDSLCVHSALPYHASYRDHEKGSWLCQDLVQVLSEQYLKYDFETMLKCVSRMVQNRLSIEGKKKQGIHIENINLRADIYFNRDLECQYLKN